MFRLAKLIDNGMGSMIDYLKIELPWAESQESKIDTACLIKAYYQTLNI